MSEKKPKKKNKKLTALIALIAVGVAVVVPVAVYPDMLKIGGASDPLKLMTGSVEEQEEQAEESEAPASTQTYDLVFDSIHNDPPKSTAGAQQSGGGSQTMEDGLVGDTVLAEPPNNGLIGDSTSSAYSPGNTTLTDGMHITNPGGGTLTEETVMEIDAQEITVGETEMERAAQDEVEQVTKQVEAAETEPPEEKTVADGDAEDEQTEELLEDDEEPEAQRPVEDEDLQETTIGADGTRMPGSVLDEYNQIIDGLITDGEDEGSGENNGDDTANDGFEEQTGGVDEAINPYEQEIETAVGEFQQRLMQLGYMEYDPVPQVYDTQTQLAVIFFQRNHGLSITGEPDEQTVELVMSDGALPYQIGPGTEGEDVRQLQQNLLKLGYSVSGSGIFDDATAAAVTAYKQSRGMSADYFVDINVRKAISAEAAIGATNVPQQVEEATGAAEILVEIAAAQLDKPYEAGAAGPDSFDSAGLVYYALTEAGYAVEYMTAEQWANAVLTTVNTIGELQRGDIACFDGQVGIYIGDGRMIDASAGEGKVRVSSEIQNSAYWSDTFICGKRLY